MNFKQLENTTLKRKYFKFVLLENIVKIDNTKKISLVCDIKTSRLKLNNNKLFLYYFRMFFLYRNYI